MFLRNIFEMGIKRLVLSFGKLKLKELSISIMGIPPV